MAESGIPTEVEASQVVVASEKQLVADRSAERPERLKSFFGVLEQSARISGESRFAEIFGSLRGNPDAEIDFSGLSRNDVEIVILMTKLAQSASNFDQFDNQGSILIYDEKNPFKGLRNEQAVSRVEALLYVDRSVNYASVRVDRFPTVIPQVTWKEERKGPQKVALETDNWNSKHMRERQEKFGIAAVEAKQLPQQAATSSQV